MVVSTSSTWNYGTCFAFVKSPILLFPWSLALALCLSVWIFLLALFYPHHFVVGIGSQLLPLLLKVRAREAASWQDIPALCQVAHEQVLSDFPTDLGSLPFCSQLPCLIELMRRWGLARHFNGRKLLCWIMSACRGNTVFHLAKKKKSDRLKQIWMGVCFVSLTKPSA